MPFFKDIWKNINNPDKVSPFAQQYAAQLFASQQRPGVASMGSKLAAGLLMRGQNKAMKKEEEQMMKDREEFFGLLQPGEDVMKVGLPTGTPEDPFTPMSTTEGTQPVPGGVLAGKLDPFVPMSSEAYTPGKMTPEKVAVMAKKSQPDVWSAMVKAAKSKDPMLQGIASQYMTQQLAKFGATLDPKDRHFVTPQGIVIDRQVLIDTGDFDKATMFNPIKEEKYAQTWMVEDEGKIFGMKPGGEVEIIGQWNPKKPEEKPQEVWSLDEKAFAETGIPYQIGRFVDPNTGKTTANLGRRLQPGTAQGTYRTPTATQNEIISMKNQAADALQRLEPILKEFRESPDLQDYFTLQGKLGYGWDTIKDKLGKMKQGSPEYNQLVRVNEFVARIERNSARMIKEMTGAQMSEAEARRLLKGIANSSDGRAAFEGKLMASIEEIKNIHDAYLQRYAAMAPGSQEAANEWVKSQYEDLLYRAESGQIGGEAPSSVQF